MASRLQTARSVLETLRGGALQGSSPPAPHSAAHAAPSTSYTLRLSAFTQAGGCGRMTTPFTPASSLQYLHATAQRGESVALLGALRPAALRGDAAPVALPTLTASESLALRDGVGGAAGQVDAAALQLLHPLGLQGWRAQPGAPRAVLAPGYRARDPAAARAAYEAEGQRAASAADLLPAHAWPTGLQHSFDALRLSVLPPEAPQPSARAGYARESLALLGSLRAWRCEGALIEQRRQASAEAVA